MVSCSRMGEAALPPDTLRMSRPVLRLTGMSGVHDPIQQHGSRLMPMAVLPLKAMCSARQSEDMLKTQCCAEVAPPLTDHSIVAPAVR